MTNSEFDPAINKMVEEITRIDNQSAELKRTVNQLCKFAGKANIYSDIDVVVATTLETLKPDQFFGIKTATAIREYLSMRGDSKSGGLGAASVSEIYDAMIMGGYAFDTKNDTNSKRSLRASLSKNTSAFTRVGGSDTKGEAKYGLKEWYPTAKEPKKKLAEELTPTNSDLSDAQINNQENGATDPIPQGSQNPSSDYSNPPTQASENSGNTITPPFAVTPTMPGGYDVTPTPQRVVDPMSSTLKTQT